MFLIRYRKLNALENTAKEDNSLNVGVFGCAKINSSALYPPLSSLSSGKLYAIASRNKQKAEECAKKYGIPVVHLNYLDMLNDPNVHIIYIPSPNGKHCEHALMAIKAGKHVLCEKPLTSNLGQALEIQRVLKQHPSCVFGEAFHWKCHPAALFFGQVLQNKCEGWDIGKVKFIETAFHLPSFSIDHSAIQYDFSLAGGATMDTGTYSISTNRFVAEKSTNQPQQLKIIECKMDRYAGDERIDVGMKATIEYEPSGIKGAISTTFKAGSILGFRAYIHVLCENGELSYTNFISPSIYHSIDFIGNDGKKLCQKVYDNGKSTFYFQMKAFLESCQKGALDESMGLTGIDDSVKNMEAIDQVYLKAGLPLRS
jgi:predicted dehydrogenase